MVDLQNPRSHCRPTTNMKMMASIPSSERTVLADASLWIIAACNEVASRASSEAGMETEVVGPYSGLTTQFAASNSSSASHLSAILRRFDAGSGSSFVIWGDGGVGLLLMALLELCAREERWSCRGSEPRKPGARCNGAEGNAEVMVLF